MKQLRRFMLLIALFTLAITYSAQAQPDLNIAYGETRSAFYIADAPQQKWAFQGEQGDIVQITAQRIAGRIMPTVRLSDASGEELALSTDDEALHKSDVTFLSGLPEDGIYTIDVMNQAEPSTSPENPDEYALTVTQIGHYRDDNEVGIGALPALGTTPLPALETGESEISRLGVRIYGELEVLPPEPSQPNTYNIQGGGQHALLDNNFPLSAGIRSISLLPEGLGFVVANDDLDQQEATFFTDQDVRVAYVSATHTYTFTFTSGQVITTDFYRISAIQAVDGLVAVTLFDTDAEGTTTSRRALFSGQMIDLRRPRQGPNEEPLNAFLLDNGDYVYTDVQGWHTLAYLDGQLQVLYGGNGLYPYSDGRFVSDAVQLDALLQEGNQTQIHYDLDSNQATYLTLDWHLMGDVLLEDNTLHVQPLDGRDLTYAVDDIASLLIVQGGVRARLADGHLLTSLPDGTQIETPTIQVTNSSVLPTESGYIPRGYNNLGADYLPTCPCAPEDLQDGPVNPANGNFYMAITDISLPDQSLPLMFTRYFNSMADDLVPAYLHDNNSMGTLGPGWRHSYQYDLDIAFASQGTVWLILPSGSQHIFTQANEGEYTSRTLPQWRIQQIDGPLGRWVGNTTEGLQYDFDRAGRLQYITDSNGHSLYLVQAPIGYVENNWDDGTFVVEPYGRRLEVYTNHSGHIEQVNDPLLRSTKYTYENDTLTQVIQNGYSATYGYDSAGTMRTYDDPRSPIASSVRLTYDERGRIISTLEAPDDISFISRYDYDDAQLITRRTRQIGDTPYIDSWHYTDTFAEGRLLTSRTVGSDDYEYAYSYNGSQLVDIRLPNLTRYSFQYDASGNLTRIKDPFAIYEPYQLAYGNLGQRSLLTTITYPNGGEDRFTYNATGQRIAHEALLTENTPVQVERHEYDDWGRLALTVTADNSATAYFYDDFGYVAAVWEGIEWAEDDTLGGLTPERAAKITTYQHDLVGQLRSITDSSGNSWLLNWQYGQVSELVLPGGSTLHYTYDPAGKLLSVDDRGAVTTYEYDDLGHLTRITDPLGNSEQRAYDALGRLVSSINAVGEQVRYAYDLRGNLIEETSPSGYVTTYEIIEEAPPSSRTQRIERGPTGRVTTWRYDANGRLIQVTITDGSVQQNYTLDYNAIGLPLRIQKENGRTISYTYDLRGNVTSTQVGNLTTRYAYDALGRITRVTEADDSITSYTYDVLGNIATITRPDGHTLFYDYDANGRVATYTDALGRITHYTYDANGNLSDIEDEAGGRTTYSYDERGNLVSVRDPLGNAHNFAYDLANNFITEIDGLGHEVSYSYDALNRLIGMDYNAQGRDLSVSYNPQGLISSISAYRDRVRELYSYDPLGQLTSITNALGYTTTFRYNNLGELSGVTDAIGNEQTFSWQAGRYILGRYVDTAERVLSYENVDSMGRLLSMLDLSTPEAGALNTRYAYDALGAITQVQRFNINSTADQVTTQQYEYDLNGWPVSYVDANGGQWRFTYDAAGQLTAVQQSDGIINTYVYDIWGNITQATYATGTPTQSSEGFTYDAAGNLTEYSSPDGTLTHYSYDSNNNLISVTQAVGTDLERTHQFAYNDLGQIMTYTDPMGTTTEYRYSRDNLVQVRQPLGDAEIATFYEYDLANNLVNIRLPHTVGDTPSTINLAYNALNQRVRYTDTASNVWAYNYDNAGNLTQISDPLGSITRYAYDSYDRLARITLPTGATVNYSYDIIGNLEAVALPANANGDNQTIQFEFDHMGNLLSVSPSDDRTIQYDYDALGRLISLTRPSGSQVAYDYDPLGQPGPITVGIALETTYDAAGRLIRLSDGSQIMAYIYDDLGRVTEVTQQLIGSTEPTLTLHYEYDAADHVLVRATNNLGTTEYTYDELGRLIRLAYGDYSVSLVYDARGDITELARSNGVTTFYAYDSNGRVLLVQHFDADGERLDRFDYRYDAVGNLTRVDRTSPSMGETPSSNASVLYTYDIAHRLISERWLDATGTTTYALEIRYDDVGNRIETVRNGELTRYSYNDDNRLIQTIDSSGQTTTYAYDDDGLMTQITQPEHVISLTYDAWGQLNGFTRRTGEALSAVVNLDYDVLNRLSRWQMTALRYDGEDLLAQPPERYLELPNGDVLLTIENGDTVRWHLNDGLGSTRRFTDAEGNLLDDPLWNRDFGSFGEWLSEAPGTSELALGANQALYEPTLGLYLIDHIAYMPALAATLQPTDMGQIPLEGQTFAIGLSTPDPTHLLESLPVAVDPDQFLHKPQVPEIPLPPDTRALQEEELLRPLYLLAQTRYGANQNTNFLAPLLHKLDAFTSQFTMPTSQPEASLNQLIALYESNESWVPDLRPQAHLHDDPFAMIVKAAPLTQIPLDTPTTLCERTSLPQTVPAYPTMHTIFGQQAVEQALPASLKPIQPQFAFMPYEVPRIHPLIGLNLQATTNPTRSVLPSVVTQLDHAQPTLFNGVP